MNPDQSQRLGDLEWLGALLRRRLLRGAWMIRFETDPRLARAYPTETGNEGVTVRRATLDDSDAVARVALGAEPLSDRLARGELVFLAEADGQPVGCTFLTRAPVRLQWYLLSYKPRPDEAYHYGLHVLPDARRRGVGMALTRAVIETAGALGARRVVCFVTAQNKAGQLVQHRLGGEEKATWLVLAIANRWGVVVWRRKWPEQE